MPAIGIGIGNRADGYRVETEMPSTRTGAMTTRTARHAILSETATFDSKTGELRVVIETPKGSRNKYDYDPDCDCLELATVLHEGMSFPYEALSKFMGHARK